MKICFCVSTFPTLSQTFVTTQVVHAIGQGHEVTVACKTFDRDVPLSARQAEALKDLRVVTWPPPRPPILNTLPYRLSHRLGSRLDRRSWRRQIDADVVVTHFGYRAVDVARAKMGWARRQPLVTVFHGRDVSVEYQNNAMALYRDLFAQGDLHVTVNAQFARQLVECGAPAARVETRHLGIPVAEYPFSPSLVGAPIQMFSVCRLVEKKGLDCALAALALLRDRAPEVDWRYDIGGDGPLADDLRDKVRRSGLQDRVQFLGALPHHDALARMQQADVVLAPSQTARDGDQEGIPVTLMEAMALGTPVCTTRHSGIPELVTHAKTGMLSDERDAEGLYQNLRNLLQDPDRTARLVRAAREKVEQEFNEDTQNVAFLTRCAEIAAQPDTRSAG